MTDGHTARTGAMRGALRAIAHGRNELGIVLEPSETMRIAREALEDKLEQHMTIDAEVIKRHRDTIALAIGRHWRDPKAKPDDDALVDLFGPCADAVVNALIPKEPNCGKERNCNPDKDTPQRVSRPKMGV